jgi:hypothetical protein
MPIGLKDDVLRLVSSLPDNMTWDDLLLAIHERMLVEQSITELDQGRRISNEDVRRKYGLDA